MKHKGRKVYMVSGGVTKFAKATPEMDFRLRVKKAFDYAMNDVGLELSDIDGSVASYFSDHFQRQLMSGIMVQDYLGLTPKPSKRVEGGGATGGLSFQTGYEEVASGRMDTCVVYGFESMSHVNRWRLMDLTLKYYRENTSLYRSVKDPMKFVDYLKEKAKA